MYHDNCLFDWLFKVDVNVDPMFGRNPFILKGEEWKEKRNEITPAFTTTRVGFI